jgi:hypothetical protein
MAMSISPFSSMSRCVEASGMISMFTAVKCLGCFQPPQ